jgi:hypothetical protein
VALSICWAVGLPALLGQGASTKATTFTASSPAERAKAEAEECGRRIIDLYLASKWAPLEAELKNSVRHFNNMSQTMRQDVTYIRQMFAECRPAWWRQCRSSSNVSFEAEMWGRKFMANYTPADMLGMSGPVGIKNGKILCVVSWDPTKVDNPDPLEGELAKKFGLTRADLAEMIVWHELGHNYVTTFLPVDTVLQLYSDHEMLFHHLQEFYADLTSIYHCGPKARRGILLSRIDELTYYRDAEEHTRASHAIGALLLAEVLNDPARFPAFHLPGKVPEQKPELNTIIYMYEHMDLNWTLAQDRAMKDIVRNFLTKYGEQVLRRRGEVPLASKLTFMLPAGDDRDIQPKRDQWVTQQLTKAIQAGKADKPEEATTRTRIHIILE